MLRKILYTILLLSSSLQAAESSAPKEILELSGSHLSPKLMERLINLFDLTTLVEIDPLHGDTTANGSRLFKQVLSFHHDDISYEKVKRRFKSKPHVHSYRFSENTEKTMSKALSLEPEHVLFWIDVRSLDDTGEVITSFDRLQTELSILERLSASTENIKNAVILINNIQTFPDSKTDLEGELTVAALKNALLKINPDYAFWILGNLAVAYPKTDHVSPSPLVEACTQSRLFENVSNDCTKVLEAEKLIIHSSKQENQNGESPDLGKGLLKGLWLLGNEEFKEASDTLHTAVLNGEDHWRLHWYISQAEYKRHHYEEAGRSLRHVLRAAPNFIEAKELLAQIDLEEGNLEPIE